MGLTVGPVVSVRWSAVAFGSRLAAAQAASLIVVFAAFSEFGPLVGGLVTAARSTPSVVFPLMAGWCYDRWSPRRVIIAAAAMELFALALVPFALDSVLGLLAVAVLVGMAASVFETVVTPMLRDLGARALASSVYTGLAFDGGKIAAAALTWAASGSLWAAVAVCLVLDVLGVTSLARRAPERLPREGRLQGVSVGPLLRSLGVFALLGASSGSLLFWQGMLAGDAPEAFFVVNVSVAAGAVCGNLSLARWGAARRSTQLAAAVSGVALGVMYAAGPDALVFLGVGAALWGAAVAWWFQAFRMHLVALAPPGSRGRASGLFMMTSRASIMGSSLVLGAAVSFWGLWIVVVSVAFLVLVAAALIPRSSPFTLDNIGTGQ